MMLLYQQIKQYIATLINDRKQHVKLPSERQLLDKFHSSRITVREALFRLETEGLIYRQNRKGWFVSPARLHWNPVKKVNYYQLAKEQGFEPKTQLISVKHGITEPVISQAFKETNQQNYWQIYRLRFLNERPVMLEEIYCQQKLFPMLNEQDLTGSITTLFSQHFNITIESEQSSIHITALPDDKAELLNLNAGAPCLKIIRKRFCQHKTLIDYNVEYWIHGAIEIEVESH